jgi:hypothetical protein
VQKLAVAAFYRGDAKGNTVIGHVALLTIAPQDAENTITLNSKQ